VLGGRREWDVAGVGLGIALLGHDLAADEAGKVDGEVAPQEGLAAGYGEDGGEQLGVELGLEDDEGAVHAGAAQVGRVLRQINLIRGSYEIFLFLKNMVQSQIPPDRNNEWYLMVPVPYRYY
jgi:hypothetical protein